MVQVFFFAASSILRRPCVDGSGVTMVQLAKPAIFNPALPVIRKYVKASAKSAKKFERGDCRKVAGLENQISTYVRAFARRLTDDCLTAFVEADRPSWFRLSAGFFFFTK